MKRIAIVGTVLVFGLALAAHSQEPAPATTPQKVIKKVPMKPTAGYSGKEMYREYCAVCHGKEGKGDGPAASEFKVPPPDLTILSKQNNGKFPADHLAAVLRFGVTAPAHGTSDMPAWGRLLGSLQSTGTQSTQVQLRIHNLMEYIETLQAK